MFKEYPFLFILFIFMGIQHVTGSPVMGYEYIQEADAWLRLSTVPTTWADAHLRCRLEGGALASPTTDALGAAMLTIAFNKMSKTAVYTGFHDLVSKKDFMSIEGIPLANTSLQWAIEQPNGDHCVILTRAGELDDVSCETEYPYFCLKHNSSMVVNRCGTTVDGYEWESCTGSCYKVHRVARTWHEAAMVCHAEGGYLAIINSEKEAGVLRDTYAKIPKSTIVGVAYTDVVLLGFWKWNRENGEWLTVHGQTLAEAGFELWDEGQPNNANGNQHCGSMFDTGLLNDTPCDSTPLAFICEITPSTYERLPYERVKYCP